MTDTTAVPTVRELAQRLSCSLADGVSPAALDLDRLLGLDEALLPLLDERTGQPAVVREEQALSVYRTLRLSLVGRGEAAVLYESSFAGYAKANEVAAALSEALPAGASALLVSANGRPEHPLLTRQAPTGWFVLACPLEVGEGERLSFGGFRLTLDPTRPPVGCQPVCDPRGRVLGWVCPDGRTLRLRFHPFASSGRLTVSRREQRIALVRELLELARPHLNTPSAGSDSLSADQVAQWRAVRAQAQALVGHVRAAAQQPLERLALAEREQQQAATRIEQLTSQLCEAIQAEGEATARASELRPHVVRAASTVAADVAEAIDAIAALPAVASCELVDGALRVETAAHAFRLPLVPANEELLVIERGQTSSGLDDAFLPLAQTLGSGNLVAAAQIALGTLDS
jgi:hypothetical protein